MRVLMLPDYRADNPYQELLATELGKLGVRVEFPAGYRRVFPIARAVLDCDERPHLVHLHWLSQYNKGRGFVSALIYRLKFFADLWLARRLGAKLVWTIHNLQPHESAWPKLEYWVRKRLIKVVDRAIAHSTPAKETFCALYDCSGEHIAIIPHGNYRDSYGKPMDRSEARRQLGIQDQFCVLFFGMIRPYKGVESLLEAWPTTPSDAMLMVAGAPLDESVKQEIERLGNQPRVRLILRRMEDAEIPVLFSAADVGIFPFHGILTSGSVVLAMGYDMPIIAPKLPGTREVLAEADDLLYDPTDSEGLLHAIEAARRLDLDSLRERTRAACDRLSWGLIASKTKECFLAARAR